MSLAVKICGIHDAAQAEWSFSQGADFVGIVLAPSRRQVSLAQAKAIIESVPGPYVAVVSSLGPKECEAILGELDVVAIQHHGKSQWDWIGEVQAKGRLAIATELEPRADIVLLDGQEPGSGKVRDWQRPEWDRPVWLAGGLTPHNVRSVVELLHPDGVDVSSGVERDGIKDRELISQFIREAKQWLW